MQLIDFFGAVYDTQFFFLRFECLLALQQIALFLLQHGIQGVVRAGAQSLLGVFYQLGLYAFDLPGDTDKVLRLLVIYLFQRRSDSVFQLHVCLLKRQQPRYDDGIKLVSWNAAPSVFRYAMVWFAVAEIAQLRHLFIHRYKCRFFWRGRRKAKSAVEQ